MSEEYTRIHLKQDQNRQRSKKNCTFKQILSSLTPKCLLLSKYERALKTQLDLGHFYFKNGDYRMLIRSYEQFLSQTIQNPLKFDKAKNTLDLQAEIFEMHLKAAWKLQNKEQIESLENVARLLQESSYNQNAKILKIWKVILKINHFIYEQERTKQNYTNIFNTYSRIYHQTPQSKKMSVWKEYVSYELAKGQPNIAALMKFYHNDIKIVRLQPLIFQIYKQNWKEVKAYWNFLRNDFTQYFNKNYKFLLILDLRQIEQMRKFIALEQADIFVKLIFRQYLKKINFSLDFSVFNDTQESIDLHKLKIELYKQNKWNQCVEYAYVSLLSIYRKNVYVEKQPMNGQRSDEILSMCDYILQFRTLKGMKQQLCCIWNEFFRSQIVKPDPNYHRILSLRNKYFEPSLGDGLIYFFLKDEEKVKGLIGSWRIKGKLHEACQLEYLNKISQQKSLKRLSYYVKWNKSDAADWESVMKRKIILRLRQNFLAFKKGKNQTEQKKQNNYKGQNEQLLDQIK